MIITHSGKKGFSLVENLLSVFLFASIVLYSISSFLIGKYTTQLSKERLIVNNLLRKEMEAILSADYSSIEGMAGSQGIVINDGLKNFSATRTIAAPQVMDPAVYGYKKVCVRIDWNGGISRNKNLTEEIVMYVTKK